MIEEKQAENPIFVFFSQKETIYFSESLDQIQLNVERELEKYPDDIKQLIIMAQLLFKYHINENEALKIYKKVLDLDPNNVDARLDIKNSSKQNKLQEIIDECYQLDSDYWRVYYTQSLKYLYDDKPIKAKNEIQIANQLFPQEKWILIFFAQQMSEYKQQLQKVEQILDEVISNGKLDFEVMLRIAYSYGSIQKADLSEKYLLKALSLNPNSSKANNNIGYYYRFIKKDNVLCIKHCMRSLKLDPYNEDSYYNLSVCFGSNEEYEESIKHLQNCLQINSNYSYALQDLVYNSYTHTKQFQYTDLALNKLIKKHPDNQYGLYFHAFLQSNSFQKIISDDAEQTEHIQMALLNNIYTKNSKYNFISYDRVTRLINKQYQNNHDEYEN